MNFDEMTSCQLYGHRLEFRCGDWIRSGISKSICGD